MHGEMSIWHDGIELSQMVQALLLNNHVSSNMHINILN